MIDAYREARAKLDFLDIDLWIGRPRFPGFAGGFESKDLFARLARYQIRGRGESLRRPFLFGGVGQRAAIA